MHRYRACPTHSIRKGRAGYVTKRLRIIIGTLKCSMAEFLKRWRGRRTQESFEALVAPHVEHLYRLAFRFTRNTAAAEDLVQDVLIKLFRIQDQIAGLERPKPWMARVLYREYVDRWRRDRLAPINLSELEPAGEESERGENIAEAEVDPSANPERDAMGSQLREQLSAAIAALSEDHRTVILFHDVEGYTLEELSTVMSLPIGTLKSRVHRARARLRELLVRTDETFSAADTFSMSR